MSKQPTLKATADAMSRLQQLGGVFRAPAAIEIGVSQGTLRQLFNQGRIERVARGLYQVRNGPVAEYPDLDIITASAPDAVVCLISALAVHELTTQIPHEVYIAIDRNRRPPAIAYPPIRCFRYSGSAFTEGVETIAIGNGRTARVYCAEKTVADCFKFRNRIGLDVAIEALRDWERTRGRDIGKLMHFAGVCRVDRIIRPYLEAIVAR